MDNIVYTHAKVFSAVDEAVVNDGAVWVRDGLIAYAGSMQTMPDIPKACVRVDATGKFIMPGMTETHAHLSFADASPFAIGDTSVEDATITAVGNAAKMLAAGFTGAVSFGSTYKIDVALRAAIESGRIIGPRL
ncbi:MAG: amidohydrolase family protein, partial [Gammaproteobacteria bacterium]|nr:amidohydrolase family protein [Gammaproteobacteria bacterium]